jgi:transposase-like protein
MRNFRSISIKEKIQSIAKKHGIGRPSVYAWTEKALDVREQALKPEK